MNQSQALSKARKILGAKAAIQVNKRVPVGEERLAEIERRATLSAELRALKEARDARREAVLLADAEYMRLRQECSTTEKTRDNLHAGYHRRVEIGVVSSLGGFGCFSVRASGDNLEEAIEALESKEQK